MKRCGHELTRGDYTTNGFGQPVVDCQQCRRELQGAIAPVTAAMLPMNRGNKTEQTFAERRQAILDELRGRRAPITCAQIASAVGRPEAALYCDLRKLYKRREVMRKVGPRPRQGGSPSHLYSAVAA